MDATIEEILGWVLGFIVLLDIFLLVLYARSNRTIIGSPLSHGLWRLFVWGSKPLGRWRATFLAFTGPMILVVLLVTWFMLLSLAAAFIIHPNLGTGIQSNHGATPTDFISALYVGGTSLSLVGASDFIPQDGYFRLFFLLTSLIGLSLVSLIVSYIMELYNNLQERNTLGLRVHLLSLETGDAAEVIAGLGPHGMFDAGYQVIAQWAAEIAHGKESHHFYPILFYFRFREPYYSVSRTALISLDTVTLIKSALDDEEYGWLKEAAAVEQLWRGTLSELKMLAKTFLPKTDMDAPPDEQTCMRWKRRYAAGMERIQRAGIKTTKSGADEYISLRTQWDRYVTLLAPQFAYNLDEIDTALAQVK